MIQTEPFQLGPSRLGTHATFDERTTHIDFQGQGSKDKVTCYTLLLYLVNKINPFYIANYNVISLLNSPVGRILQRWRCSLGLDKCDVPWIASCCRCSITTLKFGTKHKY